MALNPLTKSISNEPSSPNVPKSKKNNIEQRIAKIKFGPWANAETPVLGQSPMAINNMLKINVTSPR